MLPETDVFIMCYDCTNRVSLENLKATYIPLAREGAGETVKMILCGNKRDLAVGNLGEDIVTNKEATNFANQNGIEISLQCSSNEQAEGINKSATQVFKQAVCLGAGLTQTNTNSGCCFRLTYLTLILILFLLKNKFILELCLNVLKKHLLL